MARPALSRANRSLNVFDAIDDLPAAYRAARDSELAHGPTDPRTLAAWETVEQYGAVVHRQSRLLAGKSKGG